jgi:putative oxidoreductase
MPGWLLLLIRVAIAGTFIYAGVTKALSPLRFVTDIANYHLLPWWAAVRLAFYLPWLEIVCGVAVLFLRLKRAAICILLFLTSIFLIAVVSAKMRGINISCGCFGHTTRDLSFASHIVLNFGIIFGIFLLLRRSTSREMS